MYMNYRINKGVIIAVCVLIICAIGIFIYASISSSRNGATLPPRSEVIPEEEENSDVIVTAKHQYKDGVHTIAGTATVPTPCHRLIAEPFFTSNEEAVVEVHFSTLIEGDTCPSQLHDAAFRVSFEAIKDVSIRATWNGDPVRLNLVPVGPHESLDAELYIKG